MSIQQPPKYYDSAEIPEYCTHPNKKVEVGMVTVVVWCPDCGMILDTKRID